MKKLLFLTSAHFCLSVFAQVPEMPMLSKLIITLSEQAVCKGNKDNQCNVQLQEYKESWHALFACLEQKGDCEAVFQAMQNARYRLSEALQSGLETRSSHTLDEVEFKAQWEQRLKANAESVAREMNKVAHEQEEPDIWELWWIEEKRES